jgi:hypothetical protein
MAGFGDLVRRIVLLEKRRPAAHVAAALGLTQPSFYRRMQGRGRFDPDQVAVLLRELPDDRLPRWLFARTGILAVKRPLSLVPDPGAPLFERAADAAVTTIEVLLQMSDIGDQSNSGIEISPRREELIDAALAALLSLKLEASGNRPIELPGYSTGTHEAFGVLVDRILLGEKRLRLGELAASLGLGYHAMRERVAGGTPFSPEELQRLFRLYPEPRLADYLLRETPYIAMPLPAAGEDGDRNSPMHAGLVSLRENITLLRAFRRTAGNPDSNSPDTVARQLDEVLRQLVTLRWSTTHVGWQPRQRA